MNTLSRQANGSVMVRRTSTKLKLVNQSRSEMAPSNTAKCMSRSWREKVFWGDGYLSTVFSSSTFQLRLLASVDLKRLPWVYVPFSVPETVLSVYF